MVLDYGNTQPAGEPKAVPVDEPKATPAPAIGKRQANLGQAQAGSLPAAPDFSKPTHARFRAKLAQIVASAEAGDIAGLQAFEINPVSSGPKAMALYRDLCIQVDGDGSVPAADKSDLRKRLRALETELNLQLAKSYRNNTDQPKA